MKKIEEWFMKRIVFFVLAILFFGIASGKTVKEGTVKWKFETDGPVESCPAIGDDGTIYTMTKNGCVSAINHDGQSKWFFKTNSHWSTSPVIGMDGTIYICSEDTLFEFSQSGLKRKKYFKKYNFFSSICIGNDGSVYAGGDKLLYAFNSQNVEKWIYNDYVMSPVIGPDRGIYFITGSGLVYAFNPDGSEKWCFDNRKNLNYGESSIVVDNNGVIYLLCYNKYFIVLNPDGTEKWTYNPKCEIYTTPAIGQNGTIYLGSEEGVIALTPNGNEKWIFKTNCRIDVTPAIGMDGTIYFGSARGQISALNRKFFDHNLLFYRKYLYGNSY